LFARNDQRILHPFFAEDVVKPRMRIIIDNDFSGIPSHCKTEHYKIKSQQPRLDHWLSVGLFVRIIRDKATPRLKHNQRDFPRINTRIFPGACIIFFQSLSIGFIFQ